MKYIKLGKSDLNVSRICMGCMGFGDAQNGQHAWTIDEAHAREIIRRGLELGVNFFDTAIGYQSGTSEQYVGRALRDFAKRDEVVVATKFLPRTNEEIAELASAARSTSGGCWTRALQNLRMDSCRPVHLPHVGSPDAPLRHHGGSEQRRKGGQGPVYRDLQLLRLAALQGQRPGGARGLCQIRLRPGALQPDFPGGGAGDGPLLPGGEHCHDPLQCSGRRAAVQASRGDLQAASGGQLRSDSSTARRTIRTLPSWLGWRSWRIAGVCP